MKKVNIERMISKLITDKRNEVINALILSGIKVYGNITNQDLYDLTMFELNKGNDDLNTHLGDVIDATFDLSPLNQPSEQISNAGGVPPTLNIPSSKPFGQTAVGGALKDNAGSIISTGLNLLNGFFGGSSSSNPSPIIQAGSGGSSDGGVAAMLALQAQRDAQARDEAAAKSKQTWLIVGVVGGLVVIGGIVAIVLTRKKG